jgi:hypothetical protein
LKIDSARQLIVTVMRHPVLICILLLIICPSSYGQPPLDSKPKQEEYAFDITVRQDFYPNELGVSEFRIELGAIPAQGTGRVVIVARNISSTTTELGDSFSGCKCLGITLSKPVVKPGEESEIELVFKVEKEPVQLERLTSAFVFPKGNPTVGARIALRYRMEGMLAFNQRTNSLRIEKGVKSKDFYLPLTISPPVKLEEIDVSCEGALANAKTSLELKDGQPFLRLRVQESSVVKSVASGTVRIQNKDGTRFDEIPCFLEVRPPISIFPNRLRFRLNKSTSVWESEAMVQVSAAENESKLASGKEIRVNVTVDAKKLKTEVKPLRSGLVRVFLQIPEGMSINDDSELAWDVRVGGSIFESLTPIGFVRSLSE